MDANVSGIRPANHVFRSTGSLLPSSTSSRLLLQSPSNEKTFLDHLRRSQAPSPPSKTSTKTDERLQQASKSMEALMMKMLFKSMKKNVMATNFLKGGFAEEIFDDFLTEEWAKQSVEQGNFQIASMIYNQLKPSSKPKLF